jgi:glutathione S-transferase
MKLYFFPISSYSQKVLLALYEKGIDFTPVIVDTRTPEGRAEYRKLNPFGKVPTLVTDDGQPILESTIIIEYLEDQFPGTGPRLIPEDKAHAREARMYDRFFDFYINDSMQTVFWDGMKPEAERAPARVASAKETLDKAYALFEAHFAARTWAAGDAFSLADCAAAPALGYARMVYPFDKHAHLSAYAGRLFERKSYARVMAEASPYMASFQAR